MGRIQSSDVEGSVNLRARLGTVITVCFDWAVEDVKRLRSVNRAYAEGFERGASVR